MTNFVNTIIGDAIAETASDIHFNPDRNGMTVRFRIDGFLHYYTNIDADSTEPVISRLKVIGHMDVVERRLPQDGEAIFSYKNEEYDLRLSVIPTVNGEKAVIRILEREDAKLTRRYIGIPASENEKLNRLLRKSAGMIVISGPTGSGKSMTMHTLIREIYSNRINIVTIEDPAEYRMDGIVQIQIDEKSGLTFPSAMKAVLRQDPDVICVGEIRDPETLDTALKAALSGCLVLTTIHTKNAPSVIGRMENMGADPDIIASAVTGIISQRLVRKLCPVCRKKDGTHWKAGRCPSCRYTGYSGRTGVFEIFELNDEIREMISREASQQELEKAIKESDGFVTMEQHAMELVRTGITSEAEIRRVFGT